MITASQLTCAYVCNPMGLDTARPRFGWVLGSDKRGDGQTAYQVIVASSPEKLAADAGDKWDSGKVESDASVNVPHGGAKLASAERCFWKVRLWDARGQVSPWSEPASFEMGLLEKADWKGKWIGADPSVSSPLLRKQFELAGKTKRARAYVSGLGWHELYINGRQVADHVLDPATSDYGRRVYYVTHDVTGCLKAGANAVGVMLGNGWFSEPGWKKNVSIRDQWYGTKDWERGYAGESPQLLVQINVEMDDGRSLSVVTDETWKTSPGPITWNDFYNGETYDARLEKTGWHSAGYDDSDWPSAEVKDAPGGRMVSQMLPPIKVIARIRPVKVSEPRKGVYVFDMGQLFGGWASVRLKGPGGARVAIRYSALIDAATGLLDRRHHPDNKATDYYMLKGDPNGETYQPRFTYHPVRYVQIEDAPCRLGPDDVEGCVVHSDVDLCGGFECSNELLNRIHRNVLWTFTNGLYGIPLDCLYREHWAWTDPATITGTLYPRKHMPDFWTKWLDDIADAQRPDGAVPNICPNYRGDASDPAWGGNYPLLVWYLHQYYDDTRILENHYAGMKRCVDYLASIADGCIVKKGFFGDHMLPGDEPGKEQFISSETPPPLVWTGYFYRGAFVVAQAARVLGRGGDAARYGALAERIRDAFNAEWFNESSGQYAGGAQTANLLPLALSIVPEANKTRVLESIVRSITARHDSHLHTGNTGTTCMIDTLTRCGQGELMYKVATQTTYPGWGYMVAQGATTIWESWSLVAGCGNAESMIMWATIDEFFYNDLAGIKGPEYYGPDYAPGGFRMIEIEPHALGDLQFARASIRTVRGMISSNWRKTDRGIRLEVAIPVGSHAKVSLPKMSLRDVTVAEGGQVVWRQGAYAGGAEGISAGCETDRHVTFEVGGGEYRFELAGTPRAGKRT